MQDIRTLTDEEIVTVSGGEMSFYGMNCGVSQNAFIGAIDDFVGGLPVVGDALSAVVTGLGRAICG
jgi:hypothetical protein